MSINNINIKTESYTTEQLINILDSFISIIFHNDIIFERNRNRFQIDNNFSIKWHLNYNTDQIVTIFAEILTCVTDLHIAIQISNELELLFLDFFLVAENLCDSLSLGKSSNPKVPSSSVDHLEDVESFRTVVAVDVEEVGLDLGVDGIESHRQNLNNPNLHCFEGNLIIT